MDEKQKELLNEAISQLSEEDQLQIAGGGKITEEQCEKIKSLDVAKYPGALMITGYATHMPYDYQFYFKSMDEKQKTQGIVPTDKPQSDENSL